MMGMKRIGCAFVVLVDYYKEIVLEIQKKKQE